MEFDAAQVTRVEAVTQPHASLDAPLMHGEGSSRLVDSLADDVSPAPDAELIERALMHRHTSSDLRSAIPSRSSRRHACHARSTRTRRSRVLGRG